MTIKLNEFDKKLLSQITPSSKWDKLKSIYAVNSIVKQLKIGNKKIGTKCAKHLQKLSKQDTTNINEIREGCIDLRIKKKQTLPLTKDKTKRPVESVHKINKATDKAPTGKTGGGGRGGRGGGGAAQPQADLIGGLFNAFKAQQAKQARDTQYNELDAERRQNIVNQQIPQGAAGDALRQRMRGPAAQQYLDALKEASSITGLSQGERLLYQQLLYDRDIAGQAQLYNVSGDYSMKSESVNLLNKLENKIYASREQDLTGFNLPPTPRSVFTASSQISDDTLTPRTVSTDSGSGMGLFAPLGETPQTSLQSEVKKKSFESEKLRSINNSFEKVNDLRTRIQQEVNEGKMSPAQASEGLEKLLQLETTDLAMRGARETLKMQTNIIDDIDRYNKLAAPQEAQENLGFQNLTKKLQNRESELEKNRLLNQLIINGREQKQKQLEDTLQNLQLGVMDRTSGLAEQQNIFNQQSEPLGLTRTSSLSLLERMEADSLRQSRENQDLQRTLSAPTVQSLDVGRAERKIREQQESEAIFNRKQQELAQEIKNLKTEPPLMAFGEEDNTTARPIEKKKSPRDDESPPSELPSEEMLEMMYRTNYTPAQVEEMEFLKKKKDEEDYEYFEEHYTQGTDEAGDAINDLKNNLNQYKNTGNIKSNFLEEDDEEFIKTKNELKKLKPQELDKLIQLTDKLDNDLGYETSGSYKDYGKKQYANAVKSKNELYDFAKSININVDTLAFERGETIDENLPVFSDSD